MMFTCQLHYEGATSKTVHTCPHTLQSRGLKACGCWSHSRHKRLGTRDAGAAAQSKGQVVSVHPVAQQDAHARSTERLHQQRPWPAQVLWPSNCLITQLCYIDNASNLQNRLGSLWSVDYSELL